MTHVVPRRLKTGLLEQHRHEGVDLVEADPLVGALAGVLKSFTYSDTTGATLRRASATTAAKPGAASPRPRYSGRTQTPWIWQACGVTAPISALKITRPSSILAKARPALISSATLAR